MLHDNYALVSSIRGMLAHSLLLRRFEAGDEC